MKNKLSLLVLLMLLLSATSVMAATTVILDCNSSACTMTGKWEKGNQGGYNNEIVFKTDKGTVEWSDKTKQGIARVSIWTTVDEVGASNPSVKLRTEYNERTEAISFSEGYSGWKELGFVMVTGGGLFITMQNGNDGENYASAVKIEYLDDEYRSLEAIATSFPKHIILGTHASIGYCNSERIDMKGIPKIDAENAYVSKEAMLRYFGAYVKENDGNISFAIDGKVFAGSIDANTFSIDEKSVNGTLATEYEGKVNINLTEVARQIGKKVFVSNKGLVIITDVEIKLDEKTDKKEIMNVLSLLRNEEM